MYILNAISFPEQKKQPNFYDFCKSDKKTEILPSPRQTSSAKLTCLASQSWLLLLAAGCSQPEGPSFCARMFPRTVRANPERLPLRFKAEDCVIGFLRQRCCVVVCSSRGGGFSSLCQSVSIRIKKRQQLGDFG